jgi:hypothetical protein
MKFPLKVSLESSAFEHRIKENLGGNVTLRFLSWNQ